MIFFILNIYYIAFLKNNIMDITSLKNADLENRLIRFSRSAVFLKEYMENTVSGREFYKRIIQSVSDIGACYVRAREPDGVSFYLDNLQGGVRAFQEAVYWLRLIRETNALWGNVHIKFLMRECQELQGIFKIMLEEAKAA